MLVRATGGKAFGAATQEVSTRAESSLPRHSGKCCYDRPSPTRMRAGCKRVAGSLEGHCGGECHRLCDLLDSCSPPPPATECIASTEASRGYVCRAAAICGRTGSEGDRVGSKSSVGSNSSHGNRSGSVRRGWPRDGGRWRYCKRSSARCTVTLPVPPAHQQQTELLPGGSDCKDGQIFLMPSRFVHDRAACSRHRRPLYSNGYAAQACHIRRIIRELLSSSHSGQQRGMSMIPSGGSAGTPRFLQRAAAPHHHADGFIRPREHCRTATGPSDRAAAPGKAARGPPAASR